MILLKSDKGRFQQECISDRHVSDMLAVSIYKVGKIKRTFREGGVEAVLSSNTGEVLYNGIRLPKQWPPRVMELRTDAPMPVPYLEAPPVIIPVDTGRQLFVDDFLIEHCSLEREFHYPVKYEGNPVLKPETVLERNVPGCSMAGPKSGGMWWDPEAKIFKLWYEAGWLNTICLATSRDGLNWERPELDINPGTNQVLPSGLKPDSWSVIRDYRTAKPQERYKMFLRESGGG